MCCYRSYYGHSTSDGTVGRYAVPGPLVASSIHELCLIRWHRQRIELVGILGLGQEDPYWSSLPLSLSLSLSSFSLILPSLMSLTFTCETITNY